MIECVIEKPDVPVTIECVIENGVPVVKYKPAIVKSKPVSVGGKYEKQC